jgi:hypothetical protein
MKRDTFLNASGRLERNTMQEGKGTHAARSTGVCHLHHEVFILCLVDVGCIYPRTNEVKMPSIQPELLCCYVAGTSA